MTEEKTHFGFQQVPLSEKTEKVSAVFRSVSSRYDIMNDCMSFGLHRLWKQIALQYTEIRKGDVVLDLAGGTGDITALLAEKTGETGRVVLGDLTYPMIEVGRQKLIDKGMLHIDYVQANAENLPFKSNTFDKITIGFGLRNVAQKEKALAAMSRVLKPGGKIVVLEFSKPTKNLPFSGMLNKLYDLYSFHILPKMGELIAQDRESYQYLAESIRMHPSQEVLLAMMNEAGFTKTGYQNLLGGIVAIHYGTK
jgi:demethylmenaquinone methyltransferase/2-methoxy-6-polyprenyl-1,4-benzoquinol methylase